MTTLGARLQDVLARIARAAQQHSRDPAKVLLLAVSKTWPAASVAELAAAGQRAFGESYVQEGVDKITALHSLRLDWHFIGSLQSNKTRIVAESFDWVHSVDRLRIAQRLSEQRPDSLPRCRSACRSTSAARQRKVVFPSQQHRPWRRQSRRCRDYACVA
jgi:pyridoxal phosphate enzyme (YggS family)